LTVADNQLTLTTTYRNHRIDRFDTCLQWFSYRLTEDNTGSFTLNRHFIRVTCNRTFTIDWLAERVYHTSKHTFTYFNRCNTFGTFYRISFFDFIGRT